ncbi:DUF309 domain-containing protein [bacterium]|nr:DUF309 domain-containing protein [bacterium]
MDKHEALLENFLLCLKEQRYYDAHESLEVLWFPRRFEEEDEIKLLKGFINASVCFELIKRGKQTQSKKVWDNYLKYRPLLYKIDSPYKSKYHLIARHVEALKIKLDLDNGI